MFHPLRGCVLKYLKKEKEWLKDFVPPPTGVCIEIETNLPHISHFVVSPPTGVCIEISKSIFSKNRLNCFTPTGVCIEIMCTV